MLMKGADQKSLNIVVIIKVIFMAEQLHWIA